MGQLNTEHLEEGLNITGPPVGYGGSGGDVDPDQGPTSQEGDELTDPNPGVEEGTTGVG